MIPLVFAMIRARLGQAATVAALAMFATVAAVCTPGYQQAVDRTVAANAVADATITERTLSVTSSSSNDGGRGVDFVDVARALLGLPGFTEVFSQEYPVLGLEPDPHTAVRMVYRQDFCPHLRIVTGRCVAGEGEVVLDTTTAKRLKLAAGDPVSLTYAQLSTDPNNPIYLPAGPPTPLVLVGTYVPRDRGELYWGTRGYFPSGSGPVSDYPAFTNAVTMGTMTHDTAQVAMDALPTGGALDAEHVDSLSAQLNDLNQRASDLGSGVNIITDMPELLSRIKHGRALAHQVIPVAAVPLVLLAWFVIFLAVGYGIEGRRGELGLVALRGGRAPTRWWLATGESLLPIVVGCLAGLLVGPLAVRALAAWRFNGRPGPLLGAGAPRYALLAGAGAVIAALLAQRRELFTPVAQLLRRVPTRSVRWRSLAGETVIVLLAVVAVVQLRVTGGVLNGVGLLVPPLVILALGLVGARLGWPVVGRYGSRALRRGRVAPALAALALTRRPGGHRLFLVLAAAVAVLGFASSAVDVASRARVVRAEVTTGAPRVLSVGDVTRGQLLEAVRAADPQGRFAMAVAGFPEGAPGESPKLGVDTSRLAAVALWRPEFGSLSASQVATLLRPSTPAPITWYGQDIALDVDVASVPSDTTLTLKATVSSLAGRGSTLISFGQLRTGRPLYQQRVPLCADGCRLSGLHVDTAGIAGYTTSFTLMALRTIAPDGVAVPPQVFASANRWRATPGTTLKPDPRGLQVTVSTNYPKAQDGWIKPVDAPYPLPVVGTSNLPAGTTLAGLDNISLPVTEVGRVSALPRLGTDGTLVDLEYADRLSTDAGPARDPQVWLGPAAPPDAVARLAKQGLVVYGEQTVSGARRDLDRQGPALALWFHLLAGALAVVLAAGGLGLISAVDRNQRAQDLAALRVQGVGRRALARSALLAYPLVVVASLVTGLVLALAAWWSAGWGIPVFTDSSVNLPLPAWPSPLALFGPWLGALVLLVAAGLLAGNSLRRTVERMTTPDSRS